MTYHLNTITWAKKKNRPLIAYEDDRPFSSIGQYNRPSSKMLVRAKSETNQESSSLLRSDIFGSTVSLFDADDNFKKV